MKSPTACETQFNLDRHLVSFLQDNPFFAELSRHIHKTPTLSIPTAGVSFDEANDELCLWWNPEFFAKLTPREVRGVLTHEYYHLVFGHLYGRRRKPAQLWNVATDLAINSIIVDSSKQGYGSSHLTGERILPEGCLLPGTWPTAPNGREFTEEEKQAMPLAQVISQLPTMQSSEWYFDKIQQDLKDKLGEGASIGEGTGSFDDHDMWESVPDEVREYVEGKVKSVVEQAVRKADAQPNGWGNVPMELSEAIRKSVSNVINWRSVLRQFVGAIVSGDRSTSIKRINRRYPYIHPGVKRGHVAKLLIAIDQSGSVDDKMLSEFFAELGTLTKKVTIDVVPFDTAALEKDVYTWRRGAVVEARRVRCGGTDFNAPTVLANDPKNRGRWDGLLIMTDGECGAPGPSRLRRGYVVGKGHKLLFPTNDVVVTMSNEKASQGAWR